MPIKLQVVKEDDEAGEPADYLFEQDRITIGRGSGNDLTLPDQKVSTEHAEVRSDAGEYLLYDRDSKNHTYVSGRRVGEDEPYTLNSGDVFRVGDFKIEFAPLLMPSSETTAYADSDEHANPFEKHAQQLASALEGLAKTYKFAPSDEREDSFSEAVQAHIDPEISEEEAVKRLVDRLGAAVDGEPAPTEEAESTSPSADATADSVVGTLLEGVARMISIPNHFCREFTGREIDHPEEKQFLYDADFEQLRRHLLADDISEDERKERLQHLSDAVDSLVAHNMAMLAGYKKSVMAGSKELLQKVNPIDAIREAENEGGMVDTFFGGGSKSELERLNEEWKELFHGEWGELESNLFRPTYIEAYVDRMAQTWDLDKAEILQEES